MSEGPRLGIAVVAACASATLLYAALRIAQRLLLAEPDPAEVLYSVHAGYFWRALTATYLGGMVGFVTFLVSSGRDAARAARASSALLVAAVVALVVQAVVVP